MPETPVMAPESSGAAEALKRSSATSRIAVVAGSIRRYGLLGAFAVLFLYLIIVSPAFRNTANLLNLLQQNAIIGVVACGMLVMIISGGFDLSVGAVGATASVLAARLSGDVPPIVVVVAALGIGVAVGGVNGILIAKLRINPFVTTLGMASVVSGLLFVATNAQPIPLRGGTSTFNALGLGHVWRVPTDFLVFLGCAGLIWALLRLTRFGHYVYAVGGNEQASLLSGIPIARVKILAYVIGGVFSAIAGVILLGQTDIGQPSAAADWPLGAIAVCVVGGASLAGGSGSIPATILGTLLLGTVANGLNQLNVSPYWQPTVTGAVVLAAVGLAGLSRRK
jgi:ribose/xylose/arabinose/galactoside ABC-type transport system permease subunit